MKFLARLIITSFVAFGLSFLLNPHIRIKDYGAALIFVLILGLINILLKPVLLILTLPITVLTLGIFLIVLNVLMVMLAAHFTSGIYLESFWWALIFSVMLSFFSSILANLGGVGKN
jgi:putative membrane protein